jgi:replicative DNA helicase
MATIKTDIKALDSFWNLGLKPGGLIIISARPGMGKTSFLLSIGERISQNHRTQLISLENTIGRLKQNNIPDSILLDDSLEYNVELLSELIFQNKPEVVLIDYIQLMNGDKEKLIKDLKNIAVKFNICIIATSQISRETDYRSDKRPIIEDLTSSGKMFNADSISCIDNLTFSYRNNYYNGDSQKPDTIELFQYFSGNKKVVLLDWLSLHKNGGN